MCTSVCNNCPGKCADIFIDSASDAAKAGFKIDTKIQIIGMEPDFTTYDIYIIKYIYPHGSLLLQKNGDTESFFLPVSAISCCNVIESNITITDNKWINEGSIIQFCDLDNGRYFFHSMNKLPNPLSLMVVTKKLKCGGLHLELLADHNVKVYAQKIYN